MKKITDFALPIIIAVIPAIISSLLTSFFYKRNKKNDLFKEMPSLNFFNMKLNKIIEDGEKNKFSNMKILVTKSNEEVYFLEGNQIIIGKFLDIKYSNNHKNDEFICLEIYNESNIVIEITSIIDLHDNKIVIEGSEPVLILAEGRIGLVLNKKDNIEQIYLQSKLWKAAIRISELNNGINRINDKKIEFL